MKLFSFSFQNPYLNMWNWISVDVSSYVFPRLIWNYQYLKELKTRFSGIYFSFVHSLFPSAALQKDFFTKYGQIRSFLTFTEENYNEKLNFLCLVTLTEETRNRKFHFLWNAGLCFDVSICVFPFLVIGEKKACNLNAYVFKSFN